MEENGEESGREYLRDKFFQSFDNSNGQLSRRNYLHDDESPLTNTLASSNNLVNYANVKYTAPEEQEPYYNTNPNHYHPNNYYNLTQMANNQPFIANARSTNTTLQSQNRYRKRPSPILGIPTPIRDKVDDMDTFDIMRICKNLGWSIDSAPETPKSRNYTIVGHRKIGFPQIRQLKNEHRDQATGIKFMAGECVTVIGPSPEPPRGRLRVDYRNSLIDVPYYQFVRFDTTNNQI